MEVTLCTPHASTRHPLHTKFLPQFSLLIHPKPTLPHLPVSYLFCYSFLLLSICFSLLLLFHLIYTFSRMLFLCSFSRHFMPTVYFTSPVRHPLHTKRHPCPTLTSSFSHLACHSLHTFLLQYSYIYNYFIYVPYFYFFILLYLLYIALSNYLLINAIYAERCATGVLVVCNSLPSLCAESYLKECNRCPCGVQTMTFFFFLITLNVSYP